MEPVLRISGRGALTITLNDLTAGQTALLESIVRSSDSGAGSDPAPFFFSSEHTRGKGPAARVLTGNPGQLKRLFSILAADHRIPSSLSQKGYLLLDNYLRSDYKIDCRGKVLNLGSRTHIMGILNATPDSFSDGGRYADAEQALTHAR